MIDPETVQARRYALKRLVVDLTTNTRSLAEIGARVKVLEFICSSDEEKSQRSLANNLNLSDSRISRAISFWRHKVDEILSAH